MLLTFMHCRSKRSLLMQQNQGENLQIAQYVSKSEKCHTKSCYSRMQLHILKYENKFILATMYTAALYIPCHCKCCHISLFIFTFLIVHFYFPASYVAILKA